MSEAEDEINPLEDALIVKSETCEDSVESGETSLIPELKAESIDCKGTIKLEIKQEIQDTEDLQDHLSTEVIEQDLHIDDVTIEEFKIEDNI